VRPPPGPREPGGGSEPTAKLSDFLGGSVRPGSGPDQWLVADRLDAESFRILTLEGTADLSIAIAAPQAWVVASVLRGRVEISQDGTTRRFGSGEVFLACAGVPLRARYRFTGARLKLVALPARLMLRLHGPGLPPGHRPASLWDARAWRRLLGEAERMMADPMMAGSPLVGEPLARLLAGTAITVLTDPPTPSPLAGEHRQWPATVDRAVDFMESGADLQIGVADVARAADVTPRALQLAFRRHLGTSPMAYLRRLRLELARADLTDAVPGDGTTVTAVAARWGFSQPGRFAASYRQAFNESPRETLHR
jgi:AraC-like DNA-binding protein